MLRAAMALVVVGAAVGAVSTADRAMADSPPPAATVVVDNHAFAPAQVRVARGGTVAFDVREGGHTVLAVDGSFRLRGGDGGTLPPGSTHEVKVPDADEFVPYYCEMHTNMSGRIVVGNPSAGGDGSAIRVPEDESLVDAVLLAEPGDTIDLAPGVHELLAPLPVAGERVTIRGRTGVAGDVVIAVTDPQVAATVELTGRQVELRDLTVVAGRAAGVRAKPTGVGLSLHNVSVVAGASSQSGVVATGVNGLRLDDVRLTGFRGDALVVQDCPACGLWVSDLHVSGSRVGIRFTAVGGALVTGSVIDQPLDGVVLSGVAGAAVSGVTVTGAGRYGIAIAGGLATDTIIRGNSVAGSGGPDLAWDGIGARTCFEGNDAADVAPPTLTDTAPCTSENPWSVPWPVPTADQTSVRT